MVLHRVDLGAQLRSRKRLHQQVADRGASAAIAKSPEHEAEVGLFPQDVGHLPELIGVAVLVDRNVVDIGETRIRVDLFDLAMTERAKAEYPLDPAEHEVDEVVRDIASGLVAVLADGGWKYLSGDFWDADDVEESMESTLWW